MIDISRSSNDLFYRYKMPRVSVRHEGKTGGIRTVIANLVDVAASLKRSPAHILKFMSYKLAAQSKADGQRYIINGKHDTHKIQELVYDFVDAFVMCPGCDNPETFFLNEGGLVMECLACGKKSRVEEAKLNSAILKDLGSGARTRPSSYFPQEADGDERLKDLLSSEEEKPEEVHEALRDLGIPEDEYVPKILSLNDDALRHSRRISEAVSLKTFLGSLESYVEASKKEEDISKHLRTLEDRRLYKRSELFRFFTKPQGSRKRSAALRKEINEYFSD
jgi:translation initiation factor 5